ncbi:putative tyrosine--tRNA ligase, mitochondrial [Apostichopus japonicus]|uniref:Tyrosine--tRNA ligase n=1 Tax=Stichopus japonicus TaxID=307972 RepID=A0A2G8KBS2_STIJA|nr:putative tyrosine--tRNA ligase, mitochondrial [Apostichopus japonicus]
MYKQKKLKSVLLSIPSIKKPSWQILKKKVNHLTVRYYSASGSNILSLEGRGLYHDMVPANSAFALSKQLNSSPQCIYCGFDPTADSLHVGNLLTLISLIHCQRAGHQIIALIGGATAMIGDPSGKSSERPVLNKEEVESNVKRLEVSLHRIFTNHERYFWRKQKKLLPYKILNNSDWYKDINLVKFLSTAGRHFRMHKLLSRDSVRSRLSSPDGGGSDQLGNLSSGHDFVKRVTGKDVYGITIPLLTTSQGAKLGKTAGNAVWINDDRTSSFDLYQSFVRLQDADVEKYLKAFTFLSLAEIESVLKKHKANPKIRSARSCLLNRFFFLFMENVDKLSQESSGILFIENPDLAQETGLDQALRLTDALYNSSPSTLEVLSPSELSDLFKGALTHKVILEAGTTVLELAERIQCAPRGVTAEKLIREGGLYINQVRESNPEAVLQRGEHILENGLTLVRVGKKNYFIITWI